jgi:hypothetical protein
VETAAECGARESVEKIVEWAHAIEAEPATPPRLMYRTAWGL